MKKKKINYKKKERDKNLLKIVAFLPFNHKF